MMNLLKHPVIIVLITVLAVFYYVSLDKSAQKAESSSETVRVLHQEIEKIASEVSVVEKQLEAANHPIAQEKVIRDELLLKEPGEYVLQLPDIEIPEPTPPPQDKRSPWEEWKEVLL